MPLLRDIMEEEWKEYHGYFVSNRGNIMHKRGKLIKPYLCTTKKGEKRYESLRVTLYIDKRRTCASVASLVNKLFVGGGAKVFS